MKRRSLLGGLALLPAVAQAQAPATPRRTVGVLMTVAEDSKEGQARIAAFREGLRAAGWREGGNLTLVVRWADGDVGRTRAVAAELMAIQPAAILANGTMAATTLKELVPSIPVVFAQVQDPVGLGLIASLARPGGIITGFAITVDADLIGKWLQMLKAAAPNANRATFLFNPETIPLYSRYFATQAPALSFLALPLAPGEVRTPEDVATTLAALARLPGGSLVVPLDAFNVVNLRPVAERATQLKLPAISAYRQFAEYGGLMSYGPDIPDLFRQAASYVDRILRGAKPGELPVRGPSKFETVINLKTAHALGLTIPPSILAGADEVIE
jgi:putative ABC transport system substrate-binding protein